MDRAIAFIDEHILERPRLEEVAAAACLSPSYFHRCFREEVGEPVAAYVQGRSLARAAWMLIHRPETSVTEVAMEHGFSTPSDFARAFKAAYGKTPQAFRSGAGTLQPGGAERGVALPGEPCSRRFDDLNLAYIRCFGLSRARKSEAIEAAFARLYRFASERGMLSRSSMVLGLTVDPPQTLALDRCRYYACVSIAEGMKGEGEVGVGRFRTAGDYAGVELSGQEGDPAALYFGACDFLARRWIPEHGLRLDGRPAIELYDEGDGKGRCWKALLPVAQKARIA